MPRYTEEQLNDIYDRTDGRCHICRIKLAFKNYGHVDKRAAWEVDHSNARARGGFDWLGNYLPACIPCNRGKRAGSNRRARGAQGFRCRPLSRGARQQAGWVNAALGGGGLALVARAFLGPAAVLPAMLVGARIGYTSNPEPE